MLSFWPCPARLWRLLTPSWQPLKASRILRCTPCFVYCVRIAHAAFTCSLPALACELFMELSGQCRLCCRCIDGRYVADLHLSACFPRPASRKRFLVENRFFPTFAAHLCGMCKTSLGENCFLPNHNLIAIKQLQTAQTAPMQTRPLNWEVSLAKILSIKVEREMRHEKPQSLTSSNRP